MSSQTQNGFDRTDKAADRLYAEMSRRLSTSSKRICPVDLALSFLVMCQSQSCGKCVPCRVGLSQMVILLSSILDGTATEETITLLENTANTVYDSADCAIGYHAAQIVLNSLKNFREDFVEHVKKHRCLGSFAAPVPCVSYCPANVDIPGYISLIRAGQNEDAVRLIRKDNPFAVTCAYICEHPCESHCRRGILDDAINIRGLKRYAVDNSTDVTAPPCADQTGKKVAVLGGGPCGLTAAYYLALMGHKVTVFERRKKLGGMLRYGIPAYRFPREQLDRDIAAILSTGIEVRTEIDVGKDVALEKLVKDFDALYISVGAHTFSSARVPGEGLKGVVSAVDLLRGIGDGNYPDFSGKTVVVIGGGNVAMDVTRTAIRCRAKDVYCVYRRRQRDMTATPEEVEGALAEGAELITMKAPARIEGDKDGRVTAVWVKPQLPGPIDASGRPSPVDANLPEECIQADVVIVAVGQKVETAIFEKAGIPITRGTLDTEADGRIFSQGKIFAGGECVTGPATAIRAIAGGKHAAASIDRFLGCNHKISVDVVIPEAEASNKPLWGRFNTSMRVALERKNDFDCIECGLTDESAMTECERCLRCDHNGFGSFRGGRQEQW